VPIDAGLIKWLIETYGLPLVAVGFVIWKTIGKSDAKPDVARELISKIDSLTEKVDKLESVPIRLAIAEYKIEELKS